MKITAHPLHDMPIFLAGMARSGTTWVADILNYDQSHRVLFEPFHSDQCQASAFHQPVQYIPPADDDPTRLEQIAQILSGQPHNPWVDQLNHEPFPDRLLIKAIRANLMLGWLHAHYPGMPIVLLMRHPLSVIASWQRTTWRNPDELPEAHRAMIRPALLDDYPVVGQVLGQIDADDLFERIVFRWAVLHYVPLAQFSAGKCYWLAYENLILHPKRETESLFRYLELSYNWDRVDAILRQASLTALRDVQADRQQLLNGWKRKFSAEQIQRANQILSAFGLDKLYDAGGYPNAATLSHQVGAGLVPAPERNGNTSVARYAPLLTRETHAKRSLVTMSIKVYRLHDQAVTLQPAIEAPIRDNTHGELTGGNASRGTVLAPGGDGASIRLASWVLLCPAAFEATWNGGPRPEDIEIRPDVGAGVISPSFVQSNLGQGRLTFYPGYQFKTEADELHPRELVLWVRGPINAPKDGLAALEQIVDATLLPCTVAVHWQFTRAQQTVRFEADEPFATILPYPKASLETVRLEVVQGETDEAAYEQAFQQMVDNPALHDVFARLGVAPPARDTVAPQPSSQNWAVQLTDPPPVSCICPTYGRVELLEEAIYSFLQQDYPGPKELIVLNDYDRQTLEFDHPEVRVVNLPRRFHSVGEKFKAAAALASHDLIFVWQDDDIYLPHRLSYSVAHCDPQTAFFKADQAWFWNDGQVSGPAQNRFHGGSCWRRDLFSQVHGYPHIGTGYDVEFEELCRKEAPGAMHVDPIELADIYYIYRWSGTGSYHLSAMGVEGQEHQKVQAYIEEQAAQGQIPQGQIRLQPQWKSDYRALVADELHPADKLHPVDELVTPPKRENGKAKGAETAQGVHSTPVRFLDTIDGRVDLQQFEPGFFLPERFFGQWREEYLERFGEVYLRKFYLVDALELAYLSIPKAVCTAIKLALAKAIGIVPEPGQSLQYVAHFHPQWQGNQERGELSQARRGYYRFSFVRNPFDRLVSCYRQKILLAPPSWMPAPFFHGYLFVLPDNASFADFCQRVSRIPDALADSHFKSQHALLYRGDELQVDWIGKVEQLGRDWASIAARYGLDPVLVQANVTKDKAGCHSDYRLYYTEPLVQWVYERYRKDVELFGYQEDYEDLLEFVRARERDGVPA